MKQLSTQIKALYGIGFSAQGIKDGLFQLFLFFYFSQILDRIRNGPYANGNPLPIIRF